MGKYPFESPCHPGDEVCDLAFTMFVLDQEGVFDDNKENNDEDENQTEDN